MSQILQIAVIAAATFGTGAATLTVMNEDIPDLEVPAGAWSAQGALDGKTFSVQGTDLKSGAELSDRIHFRDGTFQSADCQEYCDFGWSDYQTKEVDGIIHFTATALCPDAPHTVVWYGTVLDGELSLDVTWTTRRWYWTSQIHVKAAGSVVHSESGSG